MTTYSMVMLFSLLPTAADGAEATASTDTRQVAYDMSETAVQPASYALDLQPAPAPPSGAAVQTASCAPVQTPTCYQPMNCQQVVGCGHCSQGQCYNGSVVTCRRCNEQSCSDRCKNKCAWGRAHTTGDMYPHFAYRPQYHGYYYFRPYNYMNVYNHQSQIVNMGGDPRNPYSVSMFRPIYEEYGATAPGMSVPPVGSVQPIGSNLPKLEDLMLQP